MQAQRGEFQHLVVGERKLGTLAGRNGDVLHHLSATGVIHEFEFLAA